MQSGKLAAFCAVWMLCVLWTFSAAVEIRAGTVEKLDLQGLFARSDLALHGRVHAAQVVLDARGRPATEYQLDVERSWWGAVGATCTFRLPGGTLPDGSGMLIPGLPRLAAGEELVVFLTPESKAGVRLPVGLAQGKFQVTRDALGRSFLVREASELHLVDPRGAAAADAGASLEFAATAAELERLADARRKELAAKGGK